MLLKSLIKNALIYWCLVACFVGLDVSAQTVSDSDDQFITQQKDSAAAKAAPYVAELNQIAQQAQKNAQAPDIQNYIHSLGTGQPASIGALPTAREDDGQVLIFISSSMPITSLTQWLIQARKIGAPLILRGFVDNKLPATKIWFKKILDQMPDKKGGMVVDPIAYETFGIKNVPAVVVTQHFIHCPPNVSCSVEPFDVVYGNVSLNAALKLISDHGSESRLIAKQKLAQLEPTNG